MIKNFKDLSEDNIKLIKKLHWLQWSSSNICKRIWISSKFKTQEFLKILWLKPLNWNNKRMQFLENWNWICVYCQKELARRCFQYNIFPDRPWYYNKYCNKCRYNKIKNHHNSNIYTYMRNKMWIIRKSTNKHWYNPDFDFRYLVDLYEKQKWLCFYTDKKLEVCWEWEWKRNKCSVDKIIPEKWYIKWNIVLCLNRINTIKNNASLDEIKERMPWRYERLKVNWYI